MLRAISLSAALMLWLPAAAPAAADPPATGTQAANPAPVPLTAPAAAARAEPSDQGLAAFVAGAAEAERLRAHIAGVIVSVVKDNRTILATGFGDASIEAHRAADGENTLFRIGSISKTFTYTAAMQLIEQGVIGLDDPVNEHLPDALKVPDEGFSEPIRVRHLFTHSAGFEDIALGHLFVRDPAKQLSMDQYLAQHRPHRVRPPGTVAVYSNYSLVLLGALISNQTGLPFEQLIETRLTGPLGMQHTSFREPHDAGDPRAIAPGLGQAIATGYQRKAGKFEPGWFEYIGHGAPAGAVSATAADMARWMRVHLNEGELDGVRILKPESARAMREIMFRDAPGVDGVAHGFLTEHYGRYFAYGHGGATLYFHSDMILIPELGLGVFVSANTDDARQPMRELARLIIEHIAPDAKPGAQPITVGAADLAQYAGTFRSNRRPYFTVEKLLLGADGDAVVAPASDGTLRISAGGETYRYLPVGPRLFQDADSNAKLEFLVDGAGRVTGYTSGFGVSVSEKVGTLETLNALLGLLALTAVIALRRLWTSMRREPKGPPRRQGATQVKALAVIDALAWLALLVAAFFAASGMAKEGIDVIHTYPSTALKVTLCFATLAAVCTALEVVALVPVWRSNWRTWPKLRYTLAVAVLALTVWAMWGWNLIGLKW